MRGSVGSKLETQALDLCPGGWARGLAVKKQRLFSQLHCTWRPSQCTRCKNGVEGVVFPGQRDFSKKSSDNRRGSVSQSEGAAKCKGLEVNRQRGRLQKCSEAAGGEGVGWRVELDVKGESRVGTCPPPETWESC